MTSRGRRNKRPGRKSNPESRSRQTTRAARRLDSAPDLGALRHLMQRLQGEASAGSRAWPKAFAEIEEIAVDLGPDWARQARAAALHSWATKVYQDHPFDLAEEIALASREAATTVVHLPSTPLGALHGRGVLTAGSYAAALYYQSILEIWRRGTGLNQASCEAIYRRLIAGAVDDDSAKARYLSGDVDRPTTADQARVEIARYEAAIPFSRLERLRGLAVGEWPVCVIAARNGDAVFWPPGRAPLVLIGGSIHDRHMRPLAEIADDFAAMAELEPSPWLKKASLAA